jgi:hypothetical protein
VNSDTATPTPTITDTPMAIPTQTPSCEIRVWPNPFDPHSAVRGSLKVGCLPPGANVSIYSVSGELIRRIPESSGLAVWDGHNQVGVDAAPGIYFYTIRHGGDLLLKGTLMIVDFS